MLYTGTVTFNCRLLQFTLVLFSKPFRNRPCVYVKPTSFIFRIIHVAIIFKINSVLLCALMAGDFCLSKGDVKRIPFFHANGRFVINR